MSKLLNFFRRRKKRKNKTIFDSSESEYSEESIIKVNSNTKPIYKRSKKPSPIGINHEKKVELKKSYIIKSSSKNILTIDIPRDPESGSESDSSDKYIKTEIGYDYNKDRVYDWELKNINIIKKLFGNMDLTNPVIIRGNWQKNENLKHGWMVPCYFCWGLTTRKISYQKKHIIYACKDCLPKSKL
jgi:hypothetical protein